MDREKLAILLKLLDKIDEIALDVRLDWEDNSVLSSDLYVQTGAIREILLKL